MRQAPAPRPRVPASPQPSLEVQVTVRLQEILLGPKQDVGLQPRGEGARGQADDEGWPWPQTPALAGAVMHCHTGSSQGCGTLCCGCYSCPTLEMRKHVQKLSLCPGYTDSASSLTPTPVLYTTALCCLPRGAQRRDPMGEGQR